MSKLRQIVFFPAALAILVTITVSFTNSQYFTTILTTSSSFLTVNFAWLYNGTATFMILLCGFAMCSRLGSIRIGGAKATPLLSRFKWFSVSLTTVIAMGIVFWPVAEAVRHYVTPPSFSGIAGSTPAAAINSMATLFVHWTVTPYAIYSVLALTFALSFYNLRMPFSISTLVRPLLGKYADGFAGHAVDGLGTFAVVLGMSATLVSAIIAISDGEVSLFGIEKTPTMFAIIAGSMILLAIITAASGLQKGIQVLARINTILFMVGLGFIFLLGPTAYIMNLGVESSGVFLDSFFTRNLVTGAAHNDSWAGYWTVAYFASWFAWAPISCLFLGRIARGYTVREFLLINLLAPAVFGWFWFSVFGGTGIHMEIVTNGAMSQADKTAGFGSLIYLLLDQYPLPFVSKILYLLVCAISYVTAANANLDAISILCTQGITPEKVSSPLWIKVFWGACIATVAYLGMTGMGLDAIRALFNMSGFPGLIIALGGCAAFIKVAYLLLTYTEEELAVMDHTREPDLALVNTANPLLVATVPVEN